MDNMRNFKKYRGQYFYQPPVYRIKVNYLRNVCKAIGIEYRSVRKIRKTSATTPLNSGVDEIYVKTIMRHEDINTARSHYYYCNKRKKITKTR